MKNQELTVSVEEAQKIIFESITPMGCEFISTLEAYNRVICEDIISEIMVPPVNCSAMDGYAIMAEDAQNASKNNPVTLKVIGEIQAGGSFYGKQVQKGTAIRIMTGGPIPQGADTVVKFEDTEEVNGHVNIFCKAVKHNNFRIAGENIKKGDTVLCQGSRLRSADLGILASLNYGEVKVYKRPIVSIISTGDELAGIGEYLKSGHIRDVNGYALYAEIKKCSAIPEYLGIAKDTPRDIKEMFIKAAKSNIVISTGGVSMGKYDFIKEIYSELGIEIKFGWVNVRPGKPCIFGQKDGVLYFSLPGNPVSTLTSFIQFIRPAILKLMGAKRIKKPVLNAFLEEDIKNKQPGKVNLLRGYFHIKDNDFYVSTTGNQKASVFRSMSKANCLIFIPEYLTDLKAGDEVTIQLINHDEI